METILDYLKRNLKQAGPPRWAAIAAEISEGLPEPYTFHPLRKIAYGDSTNPGLQVAQRLIDFFAAVERGERALPESETA